MKVEKAIEILDLEITVDFEGNEKDRQDAIELGIEGLERVKAARLSPCTTADLELLPGET